MDTVVTRSPLTPGAAQQWRRRRWLVVWLRLTNSVVLVVMPVQSHRQQVFLLHSAGCGMKDSVSVVLRGVRPRGSVCRSGRPVCDTLDCTSRTCCGAPTSRFV